MDVLKHPRTIQVAITNIFKVLQESYDEVGDVSSKLNMRRDTWQNETTREILYFGRNN